ncbi:MAG: fasciclin domain-containing protein [Gammaproteobacteria bacterium]|jgi:uncharacterized surface protein with fasciclin (FAS1) repeats
MGVIRNLRGFLLGSLFAISATAAMADDSIVERLSAVDGTQALIAAVLVVDESGVLDVSIAEALDSIDDIVLFAPVNSAFETLLQLEPGFLDGLSVDDVKAALPSVLGGLDLTVNDVLSILLLHVGVVDDDDAEIEDLLEDRSVSVAAGMLPVSLGSKGVRINYEANVIKADVDADNGIIHYIDTVIVGDLLGE